MQFGSKSSLCEQLSCITGVDAEILNSQRSLLSIPLARKMSWASHRRTTRLDDVAYCLSGISNGNMPLLYGEGTMAFTRLVEQKIIGSDDHSIFA